MATTKDRDRNIEILRWIAILAVVMHHGLSVNRHSPATIQVVRHLKEYLGWCVPAFLSVSGAFAPAGRDLWGFLRTRARRLLVPFAVVSVLLWIAAAVTERVFHFYGDAHLAEPGSLLLKLIALDGYGPQLYFLSYLFEVSLLCQLLSRYLRPGALVACLVGLVAAQCAWILPPMGLLGTGLDKVFPYALCFALGTWLYQVRRRSVRGAIFGLLGVSLLAVAAALRLHAVWPLEIVAGPWLYVVLAVSRFERLVPRKILKQNSAAVFLWHAPLLIMGISVVLAAVGIRDGWNYAASCFLTVPASLAVDALLARTPVYRFVRL